jgi:hypothetical protein
MTEYQPYGVRHLLRKLDPEGAAELRVRPVPLLNGQTLNKGEYADLDAFDPSGILVYRTLVLRRSPVESRPPSQYRLVWAGKWYEVWRRPERPLTRIIEHVPLGTDVDPGGVPVCADVLRVARVAGARELAAVERPPVVELSLNTTVPSGWGLDRQGGLVPGGSGTVQASVHLPTSGRYGVWVGGAFRDRLETIVDGRRIGSTRNQLNTTGQYTQLGEATLRAGAHTVTLKYDGPDLHPGSGGAQFGMGPLVLSTKTAALPVRYVKPADARSLCGKRLDWIEALGS